MPGGVHKEIEILEHSEERNIQYEREIEEETARSFDGGGGHFARDEIIHERRAGHQKEETPVPPAVKEIAGRKQHVVLLAKWQAPVKQHGENQKENISGGIEEHICFVLGIVSALLRKERAILFFKLVQSAGCPHGQTEESNTVNHGGGNASEKADLSRGQREIKSHASCRDDRLPD